MLNKIVWVTGAGSGSVSSIIGTTSGTLTKSGTGTWTLTGADTYTGATTISAGVLNIQNATALGTTASGTTISYHCSLHANERGQIVVVDFGASDLDGTEDLIA